MLWKSLQGAWYLASPTGSLDVYMSGNFF
ncbi:unnamed protein product [Ectocarpus sp. CCAP 1310/34]|nr:unnamed protein product [Ectocarpus sp. CCAP 1310/34]